VGPASRAGRQETPRASRFYFGAEVIADAFPDATFVATPIVIEHIKHS
jgi:hypothetical protein